MNPSLKPTLGMILKGYPRISETFISNEILRLEQLGVTVRIFSMRHPRESFAHKSIEDIKAKVDYLPTELFIEFPRLFFPTALLAIKQPGLFVKTLAKAGERFARTHSLGTVKHLLQAGYLTNQILLKSPEVVHLHAHFAHSPSSVALFSSMLSGLDFSFTAHAKDIYTSNRDQLREKINLASLVVTCTRHNKQYLTELAKESQTPIHCVYHGIDLQLFSSDLKPKVPTEPYNILSVARITEKKGLETVIAALKLLKEKGVRFTYTLIGDGDDREQILERILQAGLKDHFRWLGTIPHEKVLAEFHRADVFVLGCRIAKNGDRDGIPNVLVESLAMGLPAVGTTVSGLPEILVEGRTGLLVEPDTPGETAAAIYTLLTDRQKRQAFQVEGIDYVKKHFDNRLLIQDLAKIYCSAIPALSC